MEITDHLSTKGQRDYQLVKKALHDADQLAYADLLQLYRDSIFQLMIRMCGNSMDAEDLTIEAFGKAFRKLGQYSPDYAFSTWLFRIAANNCIDFMRKSRRDALSQSTEKELADQSIITRSLSSEAPNPEQSIIQTQKIRLIREIVRRLKPHYRLLIEMRYFDELSYEEIAQQLELPMGTIKAQLFRARELLLQMVSPNDELLR